MTSLDRRSSPRPPSHRRWSQAGQAGPVTLGSRNARRASGVWSCAGRAGGLPSCDNDGLGRHLPSCANPATHPVTTMSGGRGDSAMRVWRFGPLLAGLLLGVATLMPAAAVAEPA